MNANVYLRANEETLSMPVWPDEIRNDPGSLNQCKVNVICVSSLVC